MADTQPAEKTRLGTMPMLANALPHSQLFHSTGSTTSGANAFAVAGQAFSLLNAVEETDPFDWRVHWYRGKALLASRQASKARSSFDRAYFEPPGELDPKLGIAFAAEAEGDEKTAAAFYDRVSHVDPDHTSACFGLAASVPKQEIAMGCSVLSTRCEECPLPRASTRRRRSY